MIKVTFLVFVLFAVCISAGNLQKYVKTKLRAEVNERTRSVANQCPTAYYCTNTGSTCGEIVSNDNTTFTWTECNGESYCLLHGDSMNGTCTAELATGSACQNNAEDDDDSCKPGDTCYNSVCTTITYNGAAGAACTQIAQCQPDLDCGDNNICIAAAKTGEACSDTVDCWDSSSCKNGLCVGWGSVALGGNCSGPNYQRTLLCQAGLWCNGTTCVNPASSGASCTRNSDCTGGQVCQCSSTGSSACAAITLSTSFFNEIKNVVNCFYNNKCGSPYSCSGCSLSSFCQEIMDIDFLSDGVTLPSCFYLGPCQAESASPTTAALSLFAAASAAVLLFL